MSNSWSMKKEKELMMTNQDIKSAQEWSIMKAWRG